MSAESSTARIFLSIAFSPCRHAAPSGGLDLLAARMGETARGGPEPVKLCITEGGERSMLRHDHFPRARSGTGAATQANTEPAPDRTWRSHRPHGRPAHVVLLVREVLTGEVEPDPFVQGMPEK